MLDKNDEKTIKKIVTNVVGEALEQIVLPQIQEVRNDINTLKEDIDDLKDTATRTELKLNSVVKRQDDQGGQITRINQVLKLEPKVSR